ncbi:hypothetical protein LSH36_542g02039 [Paralvinella palmiformis]|uniref:Uncharacterized protein n=1 Tax=Paralvinella palmiformis TaxID=53620 RepID=A0AAD9MW58_9ANNE|nr:hypothetical protein LSH36_542g02039 [Paralvinella palmiformis]
MTILSSLQTSRYFRSCTCDPNDFDATDCREIQNKIFMHACVTEHGGVPNPPWHRHASAQQGAPSPEELEAIEQSLDRELSCIGVRQLCLKNIQCHEAFKTFQDACAMKRDTGMCVATDR